MTMVRPTTTEFAQNARASSGASAIGDGTSDAITSTKSRNLLANPACAITVDDGHEAVIVEGTAKIVDSDEIPDFFPEYKRKYAYNIPDDKKWAIVPKQAFGFVEDDTFATSATKWRWEL